MRRVLLTGLLAALVAGAAAAEPVVFITRHAEKADGGTDPELSAAGHARAEALARILKDARLTAVYATEFKRTRETAEPTAKAAGVKLEIAPARDIDGLARKLRASEGNMLVIGHGNTIPGLIKTLGVGEQVEIAENDYDNLYLVILGPKPRLIRLHYP